MRHRNREMYVGTAMLNAAQNRRPKGTAYRIVRLMSGESTKSPASTPD
jgi:hypothetical protein